MLAYKIKNGDPEDRAAAVREFREAAADMRRAALRGAHAVLALERTGAHHQAGASSIAHFGEMNGIPAAQVREWASLGVVVARPDEAPETPPCPALAALEPLLGPSLEAEVAAGTITVGSAATLGEVVELQRSLPSDSKPLVRSDDQWIHWARTRSTMALRRLFLRRRDEISSEEVSGPLTVYVPNRVREDLDRARTLISRKTHKVHSLGEALSIVLDEWLADNDPMRTKPGTRRLPDTSTIPNRRYVPAEVDRQVRARSDDVCIVPFCDADMWLHHSHRVAHADGGSREANQLDLLCDYHHALYERGRIKISGPPDNPVVTDMFDRPIDMRASLHVAVDPPPQGQLPGAGPPPTAAPPTAAPPTAAPATADRPTADGT